ncbi:hypothetical protein LguiB_028958 [Lonicera macranthoides]
MAAVRKNKLNVVIAEQNNMVAVTSLGRICREGTSEREHRRTIAKSGSLSREDLKQHLGKKLDDAAEILGKDVRAVTVKATYGVEIIRFQFYFSSRKVDLVEKVTWRSLLKDGSFNIKYDDDDDGD